MSSKFGPRASGTDGTDFRHRQRVAAHFRESVLNKMRLKALLLAHFLLVGLMALRLLEEVLDWVSVDWGPLERLDLPTPALWEWCWMSSAMSVLLGLAAMARNRLQWMRWCYNSLFLLGLLPVAVGAGSLFPELWRFIRLPNHDTHLLLGFPMIVLWFVFFALCVQIHGFSMYFAHQLIQAWQPPVVKLVDGAVDKEKSS